MAKFYKFNDELVAKVDWRIADQLNMLAWRKKGLQDGGKELILRNCFFYFMAGGLTIIMLIAIYPIYQAQRFSIVPFILSMIIVVSFFSTLTYLGLLAGDVFNYRLTETSFEQANWNDYVPFVKKISQIPLCLIAIAAVFMVVTDPAILVGVGLGGMVGIGLMSGLTLYSKGYEKNNLNYQYISTDWSLMAFRIVVDKKRRVVLFWSSNLNHKDHDVTMFSVFCTKHNFAQVSELIINKAEEKQLKIEYKPVFA